MENFYLVLTIVFLALAITDLIVGVSNDAVNFLNSAIGSKVSSRFLIMIVASLGILVGTAFSDGMMEVARKGIFYPEFFSFNEIMVIFFAVMITDVLLLDFFNTVGLPTSTTVSIVFELLGAAVAVSVVKLAMGEQMILDNGIERAAELADYINSGKALAIISGILLSIVFAFVVGAIIQYITRTIFSFNYKTSLRNFGSIWGGIAITVITYFILIKGAKHASFMTLATKDWIHDNTWTLIGYSLIGWSILLQLLRWIAKANILKIIVLVGTFSLAMAFAGNDLVNFIGVPLAGLKSYEIYVANNFTEGILMTELAKPVKTPMLYLILAGAVMVITLWFSKKARRVTETELNLSRQDAGDERFTSSIMSRILVRRVININNFLNKVIPSGIIKAIRNRFDQTSYKVQQSKMKDPPMFDLVRASVNLTVAAILIAYATSKKLPLSTTYVTFMVAMGTSLSDRAWGRESAVYRITGVLTVISGWFLTALTAFTVAFIVAYIALKGGPWAIGGIFIFALSMVYRMFKLHKQRVKEKEEKEITIDVINEFNIIEQCKKDVYNTLSGVVRLFNDIIIGLTSENRKQLKNIDREVNKLNLVAKDMKNNIHIIVQKLQEESKETSHFYIQVIDYLREIAHSLSFISRPSFNHIDNNHKGLNDIQVQELLHLKDSINGLVLECNEIIQTDNFDKIESVLQKQQNALKEINSCRKNQIKRIKAHDTGTRNSILYLGLLNECKNFLLQTVNLLKAQRDFIDGL